jgi:redox-sensitive bicupin YhaK (pirin superfamily)
VGESRFVYVIEGEVSVGIPGAEVRVTKGEAVGLSVEGDYARIVAAAGGGQFVLAGGVPLREPTVFYGPFCMNTREDIGRAMRDFEAGRMGQLSPSF